MKALLLIALLPLGGCAFCGEHERACGIAAGVGMAVLASQAMGADAMAVKRPSQPPQSR